MGSDEIYARISEDEAAAKGVEDNSAPWPGEWEADGDHALRTHNGWVLAYSPAGPLPPGFLEFAARFDPARMLREARTLRKLLARVDLAVEESDAVDNIRLDCYLAEELRGILAEIWED